MKINITQPQKQHLSQYQATAETSAMWRRWPSMFETAFRMPIKGAYTVNSYLPSLQNDYDLHRQMRNTFANKITQEKTQAVFVNRYAHGKQSARISNTAELDSSTQKIDYDVYMAWEEVRDFATRFGDLFNPEGGDSELGGWIEEWQEIAFAVERTETIGLQEAPKDLLLRETCKQKMDLYTDIDTKHFSDFSIFKKEKTVGQEISVQPISLVGFIWTLIVRDIVEGITYTQCPGYKNCGHELPNRTIDESELKYCSKKCTDEHLRK